MKRTKNILLTFALISSSMSAMDSNNEPKSHDLFMAVKNNDIEKIKYLLEGNKNFSSYFDNSRYTELHMAVKTKNDVALTLLLDVGADPNNYNHLNETPLHLAAYYGYDNIAQILLNHKADPSIQDSRKNTALHWAIIKKNIKIVEMILQHKNIETFIHDKNKNGESALNIAQANGLHVITKKLKEIMEKK